MEHYQLNQGQQGGVIDVPVVDEPRKPEVHLDEVETYVEIVGGLKAKLAVLVEQGLLTEKVATSVVEDYMYQAFKQIVKVNYR